MKTQVGGKALSFILFIYLFPRSSFQAGYEAGPTASTIRVRTSTSSSICPRATQQRPYSLCLAGFRFAPLVYLFAYLFLGPLTLVYFSYPLFLSVSLSLPPPIYIYIYMRKRERERESERESKGNNHRRIPQDREQRRSLDIKERSLEQRGLR